MSKQKKKPVCKCKMCQNYNDDTDDCQIRLIKNCNKKGITNCTDFLIKDKLVMFR